jgi:uncharacterized membrane protein YfcA
MDSLRELLLGNLSYLHLAALLLAALATSVFHTLSGFAGGLLLSVLVAPILGVAAVVPVLPVALIMSATTRVYMFRKDIDYPTLINIMVPAVPGIVIGAVVYGYLPAWLISAILGLFLVTVVAIRRPLDRIGVRVGVVGLGSLGFAFGLLSGVTIGGGMILAPFCINRGLVKEKLAALFAAIGFFLNLTKTSVFLTTSVLDLHLVLLGIAVGLCTVPGAYLGYEILKRTSVRIHTNFVEGLVFVAGVFFVGRAFVG